MSFFKTAVVKSWRQDFACLGCISISICVRKRTVVPVNFRIFIYVFYCGVALVEKRKMYFFKSIVEKIITSFMVYFLFFFFLTKSEVGKANLSNKLNDLLTDQYGKYL